MDDNYLGYKNVILQVILAGSKDQQFAYNARVFSYTWSHVAFFLDVTGLMYIT